MIEANLLCKSFDTIKAVNEISVRIKEKNVFGLVGTNGAGKSTLLRMIAGIYKPDSGNIQVDGMEVFERVQAKKRVFYLSDDQYYFNNATPHDMMRFYQRVYEGFDAVRFLDYLDKFGLNKNRKIATFSKGMQKQLAILLGICANTKYLICDETFDGLDPVMRQAVKSIFMGEMESRGLTPIIASHNLRELEDICDHVGLLHRGGILLSKDLENMKMDIHKIQCVFLEPGAETRAFEGINILQRETRGNLSLVTVRGSEEEVMAKIGRENPTFAEVLPLSLEEIFISETEVVGYDIKKLIL
ncbi:MAG: ABC transporter ATP-binding protein [Lachnospiraceae bacterium]